MEPVFNPDALEVIFRAVEHILNIGAVCKHDEQRQQNAE